MTAAWFVLATVLGALCRVTLADIAKRAPAARLRAHGTNAANLLGCLLTGVALVATNGESSHTGQLLVLAFCGGLTTFSTWAVTLAERMRGPTPGTTSASGVMFAVGTGVAMLAAGVVLVLGPGRI